MEGKCKVKERRVKRLAEQEVGSLGSLLKQESKKTPSS